MPKVSTDGQIKIPESVQERLGIQPGDAVEFICDEGKVRIQKQRSTDPFEQYRGVLGKNKTDKIMEELRGSS